MNVRKLSVSLVALTAAAVLLGAAVSVEGAEKDHKKKWLMRYDDPYVAFVPEQPWLVATERSQGTVLLLRYPELELVRKLESPSGQKLLRVESSSDGRWLAGLFGDDSLRVWNLTTGEQFLTVDSASRAFELTPAGARLVVWQPKVGITQWSLEDARRVGPVISSIHHVFRDQMALSSDGRYLLMNGSCRDQDEWRDFCVYDLTDGAIVASTDADRRDPRFWTWRSPEDEGGLPLENEAEFLEILQATGLDEPEDSVCTALDEEEALCCGGSVALVEPRAAPTLPQAEALHEFSGRYVWEIRPGQKHVGARLFNSCALSGDRRWVAVGADGRDVLLFDTQKLEPKQMGMFGLTAYSWRQPALVERFEMP